MPAFRLHHEKTFEELPREVQLAHVLRFRGISVDRLRLTIAIPFATQELDDYEKSAIFELKSEFDFTMLERPDAY